MRFILLILLIGCVELPTETIQTGKYDGDWVGSGENILILLHIQHNTNPDGSEDIKGNAVFNWMGGEWVGQVYDDNSTYGNNKITFVMELRDIRNGGGDIVVNCQGWNVWGDSFNLWMGSFIQETIYMARQ